MGKYKKNLSSADQQEVEVAEELLEKVYSEQHKNGNNGNGNAHKKLVDLEDIPIRIKCLNEKQKLLRRTIENNDVIISTGPAGTGKTYVSLLVALSLLKKNPKYNKLCLAKSIQTIPGENPGLLPGNLSEKLEPYMYSFTGNLDKIFKFKSVRMELIRQEKIELTPLAYIRGVTIDNSIIIVDEFQNLTGHAFRSIISRIGKNSKIIFLGDPSQCDLKNTKASCVSNVLRLLSMNDNVEIVNFEKSEIVRNLMIESILHDLKDL